MHFAGLNAWMFLLRIQVMSLQIPWPHLPDLQLFILYFPLSFLEIILTIRIINDAAFLCRIYRCSIARNSSLRPSFRLPPSNPSCSSSLPLAASPRPHRAFGLRCPLLAARTRASRTARHAWRARSSCPRGARTAPSPLACAWRSLSPSPFLGRQALQRLVHRAAPRGARSLRGFAVPDISGLGGTN